MDFHVTSSSEHGRFEQIISQFLLKTLHIILESRIPSLKTQPQDRSGDLSSKSRIVRSDKWFNLALGDRPAALEKLQSWHRNLMDPMVIDIIIVCRGLEDSSGSDFFQGGVFEETEGETVIERWVVQYETSKMLPVHNGNISSSYKKMYQKSIILFRCLCSIMRHLPAYKIFKQRSTSSQPPDFDIIYKVSSFSDPFTREEEQMMKQYIFNPVEAVNGRLSVSASYRSDLSEFSRAKSQAFPPVIITDYVGSPNTDRMRDLPSMDRVSRTNSFSLRGNRPPSAMPSQRPHSWSSGIHGALFHKQNHPLSASPPANIQGQRIPNSRMSPGHYYGFEESLSPPFSPACSPSTAAHLLGNKPSWSGLRPESAPVSIPHPMLNRSPRFLSPNLSDPSRLSLPPLSPRGTRPESSSHGSSSSPSANRVSKRLEMLHTGDAYSGMTNQSSGSKAMKDSKDESGRFSGLLSSSSSPRRGYSGSSSRFSLQDDLDVCDFSCPFDVDDVDTSDSHTSHSADGKKGPEFNSGLSFGRKSQDAAVGALVHMLRTAPPLRQDSSYYSSRSQNNHQEGNFETSSGFFMPRKASDALEELKSYKEMKDLLLSKSGNQVFSQEDTHAAVPLDIKGRRVNVTSVYDSLL